MGKNLYLYLCSAISDFKFGTHSPTAQIFLTFFCLIVLIVISRPIVIAPSLVIFVIFYYLKKVFISSSRDSFVNDVF